MKIFFLGDIVGKSGRAAVTKNLNKKNILKVGVGYSFQKINKVPINKFDKKLDIIITEKYILK